VSKCVEFYEESMIQTWLRVRSPPRRSSFQAICRGFRDCGFDILPDTNSMELRKAVDEVLR
jgi:hypothetical protein